jgi:hypothetical protein
MSLGQVMSHQARGRARSIQDSSRAMSLRASGSCMSLDSGRALSLQDPDYGDFVDTDEE